MHLLPGHIDSAMRIHSASGPGFFERSARWCWAGFVRFRVGREKAIGFEVGSASRTPSCWIGCGSGPFQGNL